MIPIFGIQYFYAEQNRSYAVYCCPIPFPRSSRYTPEAHIAGPLYVFPVDISPSSVPSAIVSQMTLHRDLFVALRHDFASALETDDYRSAPDRGCMLDVRVTSVKESYDV
jgi:hypothetical protein